MNYRNRFPILSWALVAGLLSGCGSKENSPEDARLKDHLYTNRFFGFQIQVPKNWTFLDKPSKRNMREGTEAVLGGEKEMAAAAAEAAEEAHYLLMAQDLFSGTSLGVMSHAMADEPEIRTGKDYLLQFLEMVTGAGKPLQQVNQVTPVRLASREFYRVDVAGNLMGQKQHQAIFVTIEKGYALMFMVGAKSEAGIGDILAKVGLPLDGNPTDASPTRTSTSVPQPTLRKGAPELTWVREIKLQGISGTGPRRLAIINGKTFAPGDTNNVKTAAKMVMVRCIAVSEASVTVTIDGTDGQLELQLAKN